MQFVHKNMSFVYGFKQCSGQVVLFKEDNIHHTYGNAGDKELDWELLGLCIPTEDCLCPPVGSPTICGLNKHS